MGQLFRRISRLVRAEHNHLNRETYTGNFGEGTAFAAGGGAAGAAIGKIGILAKGNGFSLSAAPLTATGALTGLALYEAIKALTEGDTLSAGAAAIGAGVGAGASVAIGGVGVAVGGTAFAFGMAPMTAAGAIAGLGIAGLNRLLQQGVDLEKLLELAYEDMQEDLMKLRQAAVPVIAAQKRTQQQYEQAQAEVNKWQRRAQLALQTGDENLARLALERKKSFAENANTLKVQLDQQTALVDSLKRNLVAFECKVSEAKVMKHMLKARLAAARTQEHLQSTVGRLGTSSVMAAFERMEEKVLLQEARAKAAGELVGADLESQIVALESSSDIDDELAALKAQMSLGPATPQNQPQLLQASEQSAGSKSNQVVDAELEKLKKQLDEL